MTRTGTRATHGAVHELAVALALDAAAYRRAIELAGLRPDRATFLQYLDRFLVAVGVLLVVAGVTAFFAWNWAGLHHMAKFALLQGGIAASVILAWRLRMDSIGGRAALFAAAFLVGVLLAVFGQVYQTGADPYGLFLAWALFILPWALIGRQAALWLLLQVLLMLAGLLVLLDRHHPGLVAAGRGSWLRPLENGLMLAAFGCLLLSAIYVLPDLGSDFSFYPQPWVSTILLGLLLLHAGGATFERLVGPLQRNALLLVYFLLALIVAAAWAVPGLLLALLVTLLGAAGGRRDFVAAGIAFLVVFVATYFYGIEVTLLTKSVTLVSTGAAILLARWLLLRVLGASSDA